jgi:uncharacterized membrane protein YeiB
MERNVTLDFVRGVAILGMVASRMPRAFTQ